jgi:cyclophilin family peptidyl-prolyl cis-trans isomerase
MTAISKFTFKVVSAACCLLVWINTAVAKDPPFILPKPSEINKLRTAILFTNKGMVRFELYPEDAPWHVANLKYLADKGFYRNLTFHLYHPGYIIQGGAPSLADPNSGPGYDLPPEISNRQHEEGTLGMARLPASDNPERRSHGSQFHILLGDAPNMNGLYTVFGKATDGLDVLRNLQRGDVIKDFKVYVKRTPS